MARRVLPVGVLPVVVLLAGCIHGSHPTQTPPLDPPPADTRETTPPVDGPELPAGMTLEEVLDRAAKPAPAGFPTPVEDDPLLAFARFERLEVRLGLDEEPDLLGWEAQGFVGYDYDRLWVKSEGAAELGGSREGEAETDLLYSRLVTPFWSVQAGVQYANEWSGGDHRGKWSGVLAVQGLAPYEFELDNSLYVSEDGDVSFQMEAEYDLRLTQRAVLQPRLELSLFAQDVPEENFGAGLGPLTVAVRLRYEIEREFAPYVGLRYEFTGGETRRRVRDAGEETEHLFLVIGIRLSF